MKEKREIVYLKADRNSVCHDPKIKIQDVMSVQCALILASDGCQSRIIAVIFH